MLFRSGIYSVKSFYNCINFGGVVSPFGDSLWKTLCPQKIHVFLWLCLYNKSLTRDNVAKRKTIEDKSCLFCSEDESIQHLFFECVNSNLIWDIISDFFKICRISCISEVASFWKVNKRKPVLNLVIAASLWSIWKLRNEFCFQGRKWKSLDCNIVKLRGILLRWEVLCGAAQQTELKQFIRLLDKRRGEILRIAWR